MRGRQSAGMLSLLGVPELVARDEEDYRGIAARVIADRGWREDIVRRIASAQGKLFDVADAIDALQAFLHEGPDLAA